MTHFGLAWAQMRSRLWGVAAAVVVIALGVGLAAGILLANHSLRAGFARSVEAMSGRAALTVRASGDGTIEQALVERIEAISGVAAAVPVLVTTAVFEEDDERSLQLVGVDTLDDGAMRVYRSSPGDAAGIEDPLVFLNEPGSAIAPRSLLSRRDLARGDAVAVRSVGGRQDLTIRGVLEDDGVSEAFGGDFLIVDLYALQDFLRLPGRASWLDVAVNDDVDGGQVVRRLRDALPPHLAIETAEEEKREHERTVAGFEAMVDVVAAVGLVLAAIMVSNRLATLYQGRIREIALLRGIGWSPEGLVRALLGEAALVSMAGTALGLPLGMLVANAIVGRLAETMTMNFQRTIAAAPIEWDPISLLLAGMAGVGSGVAAGLRPARRVTRGSIVSLKAQRGLRDPREEGVWRRRLRWLVPAGALVALVIASVNRSGPIGAAAMVLLFVAAGLSIRPALRAVSHALGGLWGEGARIGLRDQSRAPGRPVGAAAVLTVGLGLVVWIANTTKSFEIFIRERVLREHKADILIDSEANHLATAAGTIRLPAALVDEVRSIPGVAAVGSGAAALSHDPVLGIFADDSTRLLREDLRGYPIEPGAWPDAFEKVASGEAALIDVLLRDKKGLKIGDSVRMATPSGSIALPVAGVTETMLASPEGNVLISFDLYRRHWKSDAVARIYALAAEGLPVEVLRQRIEERIGERYGARVQNLRDYADWVAGSVRNASSFLHGMAAITLVVVLIGTADALAASVIERTREIGILRAIGYRPGEMGSMVLAQSLAIGIAGAGLAIPLGLGMALAFVESVLPSLLGWRLEVHSTHALVVATSLLGLLACLTGGLLPAFRATHVPVVTALRSD
jgi:putative ABC transport system permease protein